MPGARFCQGGKVARRERRRERHQHEEDKADSPDLRQHHWRLGASVSKRDAMSPRFRVSEQSLVRDVSGDFCPIARLDDRHSCVPGELCQDIFVAIASAGPPGSFALPTESKPQPPEERRQSHACGHRSRRSVRQQHRPSQKACAKKKLPLHRSALRHSLGSRMPERTTWAGTPRPSAPDRPESAVIANRRTARHSGAWITPVEWSSRASFKKPATRARWRGHRPLVSDYRECSRTGAVRYGHAAT